LVRFRQGKMNLFYPDLQPNLVNFDSFGESKECPIISLKTISA